MGLLRQHQNKGQIPYYTGLQIQTSSRNVPISIVWGANKIAPNCIWTGGFYGYWGYPEGQGHGKGLGGGNNQGRQAWQYYTSWIMGLCEGPIQGLGTIWTGQSATNQWGADIWAFYDGSQTQTPWGVLQTYFPSQALSYHGLAYITSYNYYLGTSANLPQFSMEVFGLLFGSSGINGGDADPAQLIQDFLTNPQYGVGFPPASIDATTLFSPASGPDSSYQGYCRAAYLALSPALTNQEPANAILARWLKLTNTAAVWSGGKLKFVPYADSIIGPTPNKFFPSGVTFTPNVTPVYSLTDEDFIHEDGKDPVEVERSDPFASYNWQRIQINMRIASWLPLNVNEPWVLWQRENSYEPWPIDVWDQNAIETYGLRMAPDITSNEICDPTVGQIAAQTILQRGLYIRNHYKFKLSFEYCLLEPMDLVNITDSALGLNNVTVRITEIEEGEDGLLSITAEEFPAGVSTPVKYQLQNWGGNSTDQNVIPSRVNPPVIFEPPATLTGGIPKVFIAASAGVAPVYTLTETATSGQHYTAQGAVASQQAGTQITFAVYAKAGARTAARLSFYLGTGGAVGCDFDLSAGTSGAPDTIASGSMSTGIYDAGNGWFQIVISAPMQAAGTPTLYISLENPFGTQTYTGVAGDGIYLWGAQYAAGNEILTFLPAFSLVTGASIATSGAATPGGQSGVADPNWGGANVWLSTDGSAYQMVGVIAGPSRQGVLTAAMGNSGVVPDTADTCTVSLQESGGTLQSGTAIDAQNGVTLCYADGELFSYETAALQASPPNTYRLSTLYRGLYGTQPASHASGTPFVRVDNSVFQYSLPSGYVGVTLYVKLQSFNIFGRAVEDLAECQVYTYTPTGGGSPLGPVSQALALNQNLDLGTVSASVSEADQWGAVSDGFILATIDLGTVH
jgi:hypothetical protein